jgi:methylase of polypeptide subunit release factors
MRQTGMALNDAQKRQIEKQLSQHQHARYSVDIPLSDKRRLEGFIVHEGIMRPERMTSLRLARFLWENKWVYEGKAAIDMGCGSGLQGIAMAIGGAEHVYMLDISPQAVENSWQNVGRYNLEEKAVVLRSDLFGKLACKADAIVFNHPFFPDTPEGMVPVAASMLDPGGLIHRFLDEAKKFLNAGGAIIMPFFHLAGETNNPQTQAPMHGYIVKEMLRETQGECLQKGEISIFELRRNGVK